jgi:hypothetical protein
MSTGYHIIDQDELHFVTFQTDKKQEDADVCNDNTRTSAFLPLNYCAAVTGY